MSTAQRRPDTHAEAVARRVLVVVVAAIVGIAVLGGITATVAESYAANHCDGTPPTGHVRNAIVYPDTAPTCQNGSWTVTTPRDKMPEDAYGFNCFFDGDGICGPLEPAVKNCLTDPADGYTMCQDGRVFYLDAAGGKLWPVTRDPA